MVVSYLQFFQIKFSTYFTFLYDLTTLTTFSEKNNYEAPYYDILSTLLLPPPSNTRTFSTKFRSSTRPMYVTFEVITAVTILTTVSSNVRPRTPVHMYRGFGEILPPTSPSIYVLPLRVTDKFNNLALVKIFHAYPRKLEGY